MGVYHVNAESIIKNGTADQKEMAHNSNRF